MVMQIRISAEKGFLSQPASFVEIVMRELVDDAPFDICSCQFALHYSWSTEARAQHALANISSLLRPGGVLIGPMPDANVIIKKLREAEGLEFVNSVYWVRFDDDFADKKFNTWRPFGIQYKFHLQYDYELVFAKNSHLFVEKYLKRPNFVDLMRRLGALGDGD